MRVHNLKVDIFQFTRSYFPLSKIGNLKTINFQAFLLRDYSFAGNQR